VALSTDAVKTALRTTGTTFMVADSTNYNAEINRAMAGFGASGLPLYVVYPADGRPPVVLPQVLTKQIVVNALQAAAHKGVAS
jgi:thiol:disulfide interchange protein DsbD